MVLAFFALGLLVRLLHANLSALSRDVVVRGRGVALRSWRAWILEYLLVHPHRWVLPDLTAPAPFLSCDPTLRMGAGFFLILILSMNSVGGFGFPSCAGLTEGQVTPQSSMQKLVAGYPHSLLLTSHSSFGVVCMRWFGKRSRPLVVQTVGAGGSSRLVLVVWFGCDAGWG